MLRHLSTSFFRLCLGFFKFKLDLESGIKPNLPIKRDESADGGDGVYLHTYSIFSTYECVDGNFLLTGNTSLPDAVSVPKQPVGWL